MKTLAIIGIIIGAVALIAGIAAFEAWIFMLLWNHVLCAIFASIPTISFWLAWGILVLLNFVGSAFRSTVKVDK